MGKSVRHLFYFIHKRAIAFVFNVRYYVHILIIKNYMSPKSTSITDARKNIFTIADEVQKPDNHYILTENGKAKAVIMSVDEYESIMETIDVLQECPDLQKDVDELNKDIASGEYKNYTTLEHLLAEEGYVLAEENKTSSYGVRNSNKTKRRKKAGKASSKRSK